MVCYKILNLLVNRKSFLERPFFKTTWHMLKLKKKHGKIKMIIAAEIKTWQN
jgi:hypothetical protein